MNSKIDLFFENVQKQLNRNEKLTLGPIGFKYHQNPIYRRTMAHPDGYARVTGRCGDTMEIFLKITKGRIEDASFETDGCRSTILCGSAAVEMAIGKKEEEVLKITGEKILERLKWFPTAEEHCAYLAAGTLWEALDNYQSEKLSK